MRERQTRIIQITNLSKAAGIKNCLSCNFQHFKSLIRCVDILCNNHNPMVFKQDAIGPFQRSKFCNNLTCKLNTARAGIRREPDFSAKLPARPMGSGGGYIYAVLCAVKDAKGFGEDDLLRGLFIAAGIGAIAYTRTAPTGEVTGCAGECGVCGAMAAAAVAEMGGGAPEQVENAASLSLQAAIGGRVPPNPRRAGSAMPQPDPVCLLHGHGFRRPGARRAVTPSCRCMRPSTFSTLSDGGCRRIGYAPREGGCSVAPGPHCAGARRMEIGTPRRLADQAPRPPGTRSGIVMKSWRRVTP